MTDQPSPDRSKEPERTEQLDTTAEHWREGEAKDSADEVARGAERGAEQPNFGREGQ